MSRAWSYSRLKDYEKCPKLFAFKTIDKLPEPDNPAMARGGLIHKAAEDFLNKGGRVPKDLKRFELSLKLLRKLKAVPEDQWTWTKDFKTETEWYGQDAWARIKIDAVALLTGAVLPTIQDVGKIKLKVSDIGGWIVDWKTGKFRPEASVDQLELYALTYFLKRPKQQFALATLAYTDIGKMVHAYYEASAMAGLKAKWLKRVAPLQKDKKFKATPGLHCNYCHFSKKKGGPCHVG